MLPPMVVPKIASRGIAVCLPAKRISQFQVLLAELRERGCQLPVVVYHYKGEYTAADAGRIDGFDKHTRVAQIVEDPRFENVRLRYRNIDSARVRGFACKPLALMQAPYRQVMLVSLAAVAENTMNAFLNSITLFCIPYFAS